MFRAYDALVGAVERFEDEDLKRRASQLAREVAAEDPMLHLRVWYVLPDPDKGGCRPQEIADALDEDVMLVYSALKAMRRRGDALHQGGWWNARGFHPPQVASGGADR